jgi:hypothetical protein
VRRRTAIKYASCSYCGDVSRYEVRLSHVEKAEKKLLQCFFTNWLEKGKSDLKFFQLYHIAEGVYNEKIRFIFVNSKHFYRDCPRDIFLKYELEVTKYFKQN